MSPPDCAVVPEEIPNGQDVWEESVSVEKVAGLGTSVEIDGEPVSTGFGVNIRDFDHGTADRWMPLEVWSEAKMPVTVGRSREEQSIEVYSFFFKNL